MILHHLHATHVGGVDVVRGDAITPAEHVFSFDIELVDGGAIVADGAALLYFNARHFLQHIGQRMVVRGGKAGDDVGDRVAALVNAGGADDDLLQRRGLLPEGDGVGRLTGYDREGVRGVAHHGKVQHAIRREGRQRHLKAPVGRGLREGQHLPLARRPHRDEHPRHRPVCRRVRHRARQRQALRRGYQADAG